MNLSTVFRFLITLSTLYAVKGLHKTCLTWKIQNDRLTLICRGTAFEYPIFVYAPHGLVQATCSYGVQNPSCRTFNRFSRIVFDVSMQQLILTYNRSSPLNLDGIWTCNHGNTVATTTVSTSKGIYGSVAVHFYGSFKKRADMFRITLICYSCWRTLYDTIEFFADQTTLDSLICRNGRCYHSAGECGPETCSCSSDPISVFSLNYETTEFLAQQYSCKATYLDSLTGSKFSSLVTIYFNGTEFVGNGTTTIQIKLPDKKTATTEDETDATSGNIIIGLSIGVPVTFVIFTLMCVTYICVKAKSLSIKGKNRSYLGLLRKTEESNDYTDETKLLHNGEQDTEIVTQHQKFNRKCHVCDREPSVYWCRGCHKSICTDCNKQKKEHWQYNTDDHIVQHEQDMFSFDYNFKVNVTAIHDINLLDNLLVIAEYNNRQLILCHIREQHQEDIQLPGEPYRIAVVDNTTVAITICTPPAIFSDHTYPSTVVIVDVRQRKVMQRLDINGWCWGIMYRDNQLFVGCDNKTIQVINMQGKLTYTIPVDAIPYYICGGTKGHIYYTDYEKLCCTDTEENNNSFKFTAPDMSELRGITTDDEGYVLVICRNFNNVLRISPNFEHGQVIIAKIPLYYDDPYICYNSMSKSVVIARQKTVYVYKKVQKDNNIF